MLLAVVIAALLVPGRAVAQADAYQDEVARNLVERARERRGLTDHSIREYRVLSHERVSASMRHEAAPE